MMLIQLLVVTMMSEANDYSNDIVQLSIENNLDPQLVLSIAKVESNMNPKAIGSLGEIGLFQLRPEYHDVKYGNTLHNIQVAIKYLAKIKDICETRYGDAWFVCFNTGPYKTLKYPFEFSYYKKVMQEYEKGPRIKKTYSLR